MSEVLLFAPVTGETLIGVNVHVVTAYTFNAHTASFFWLFCEGCFVCSNGGTDDDNVCGECFGLLRVAVLCCF
jgi:hypothetical protein